MSGTKSFLTVRIDPELKGELTKAAEIEHRSLSSFSRLLLGYAFGQYLKAGSMRNLLSPQEDTVFKRE